VVVTETRRAHWPDGSATARLHVERQNITIVGIIVDVRHMRPSSPPQAEMYLSYQQVGMLGMVAANDWRSFHGRHAA
jgi:hypothetical protein